MTVITKDQLGIVFKNPSGGQDEVDGIYVYALYRDLLVNNIEQLTDNDKWNFEQSHSLFNYEEHTVSCFSLFVMKWPNSEDWPFCLEQISLELINDGAKLIWFGDHHSSPIVLSTMPYLSDANVYAAYSKQSGLLIGSALNQPLQYLDDNDLNKLKLG
jgi:hypothetical protein